MTPEERTIRMLNGLPSEMDGDPVDPFPLMHRELKQGVARVVREAVAEEQERWRQLIRSHCCGRRCEGCQAVAEAATFPDAIRALDSSPAPARQ